MTLVVTVVAVVVLLASYVTWTAGRLDRLHARVDAAWAALDAQLVRRAAAARDLVNALPAGPPAERLQAASAQALGAGVVGREQVEDELTRCVQLALPALAPREPGAELVDASSRVGLARSFHNSAVRDTLTLRRRLLVRALRLAGRRAMPLFFDIEDASVASGRRAAP